MISNLLSKLRIKNKLLLIVVPFFISLFIQTYYFYILSNKDIDFATQEKLGLQVGGVSLKLLGSITNYNMLMSKYKAEGQIVVTQLNIEKDNILKNIQLLNKTDSSSKAILALDTESLTKNDKAVLNLPNLKNWNEVAASTNIDLVKFKDIYDPYQSVILNLISYIGDKSNLILDPDLDSYYLMSSIIVDVPTLMPRISNIYASLTNAYLTKNFDAELKKDLAIQIYNMNNNDLTKITTDIETCIRENPNVHGISPSLKTNLAPLYAEVKATTEQTIASLNKVLAKDIIDSASYKDSMDALAASKKAIANFEAQQIIELDILFDRRLDDLNKFKYFFFSLTLALLLFSITCYVIITRNITNPITQLVIYLKKISSGMLGNFDSFSDNKDEIGEIVRELNISIGKIKETLKQVKYSSTCVDSAAEEIATGSTDLSRRTEQQAASLEETSASMESLTTNVKQNSANASKATRLASEAYEMAEEGGKVVENTVLAMNNIEKSSQKISDIITVMDEIAFQTNLLALNAAVEAARAGEAGKGFAVVASEVRTLAGRSSVASKEIKELILASSKEVENGSQMAAESGSKLKEIVESIKKVAAIVAEINQASSEQSEGIGEINVAISQMDEVTQQNAALVEESTAATQSLADQVHDLGQLLEYFKLSEEPKNSSDTSPTKDN